LGDFDFRSNAIGFLRFVLASAVVWSHTFHLGGFGADPITHWTNSAEDAGSLAVEGFFVLSGFLIVRSFEQTAHPLRYLWHRALRIFPGFWTCLVVTAFAFAPIAFVRERGTLSGFLAAIPSSPWTYVTHNISLAMNQYGIAGLLAHAPWPRMFNHSLWTLQYEFNCYLFVAALGAIALIRKTFAIFVVPLVLCYPFFSIVAWIHGLGGASWAFRAIELYTFFAIGACAYVFRAKIPVRASIASVCGLLIVVALPTRAWGAVVPLTLSYLMLYAAAKLPIRGFDRHVDLSYGIYIYAYPIQQLFALFGVMAVGFTGYFAATYATSLVFAAASWFGVESRCLALKNVTTGSLLRLRFPPRADRQSAGAAVE
jgi:peptidoglycan/LPS O-acetylase OafA/YrhL